MKFALALQFTQFQWKKYENTTSLSFFFLLSSFSSFLLFFPISMEYLFCHSLFTKYSTVVGETKNNNSWFLTSKSPVSNEGEKRIKPFFTSILFTLWLLPWRWGKKNHIPKRHSSQRILIETSEHLHLRVGVLIYNLPIFFLKPCAQFLFPWSTNPYAFLIDMNFRTTAQ